MKILIRDGLPFVSAKIIHQGREVTLDSMILDTGSAGTLISVDRVAGLGIRPEPDDQLHQIRGIGGFEVVVPKRVDKLIVGTLEADSFEAEVGSTDYGFEVDGILGIDFLLKTHAIIDLGRLELNPSGAGLKGLM